MSDEADGTHAPFIFANDSPKVNGPGAVARQRTTTEHPVSTYADDPRRQAMEADAMLELSPSAMLAGVHVTRYRPQDCACRGKHEHRYGYTEDCAVPDCTCDGPTADA